MKENSAEREAEVCRPSQDALHSRSTEKQCNMGVITKPNEKSILCFHKGKGEIK